MSTRRYADATAPRARRGPLRWDAWRQWLSARTFTPPWLPERCGRPLVGYRAAGLLQVAAILATRLLMHALAPFLFPNLLAIVLVAPRCWRRTAMPWRGPPGHGIAVRHLWAYGRERFDLVLSAPCTNPYVAP
jgi:hypothetical protein